MDLPPEITGYIGQLGPLAAVAVYFFHRLFASEAKHQKLSDDVASCKERIVRVETQTSHFDTLFQELRNDILELRKDIKALLDRKD
jgi:septal ring factor EnvC (AmiA/AmiB activator)